MPGSDSKLIDVGRIAGVYGIKGWLKVQSFTQPADNLFAYHPWWLKTPHGVKQVEIDASRPQGKGYVIHLKGVDDRDLAAHYTGQVIAVERAQLPALDAGDYYWHQLQGLRVISRYQGQSQDLGCVSKLMETGANDVLVVAPDAQSVDERERLIPYVPEHYVLRVDLAEGMIEVDWDPEF
ncbi:ribosome maturation factor RimM [Marinimicrobium sp. ABcell2]|uniref:ribosome maturation factor RimM n=1 Tax=Marinimicrobium sp. ABcell2 TaxID=3069751 RepID=UPI0027B67E69|nr:ribosome maturation factor RimM [Marinimicrobium sp. ABcell2]MDQ2077300.1 ribosome maturation factor RimM [Marinimicrobium sp. ABcell2]